MNINNIKIEEVSIGLNKKDKITSVILIIDTLWDIA